MSDAKISVKPLGCKGYGSIPHLPGSRIGLGDHHCPEGQQIICWQKARDQFDRIIVTEKLDGSNVCVANVNGEILAIGRAGYLSSTSPYEQHHWFVKWVAENHDRFLSVIKPGERIVGEWLLQAHGTRYDLPHEPFVAFDLMTGFARATHDELHARMAGAGIVTAAVLHDGGPFSLEAARAAIGHSHHGRSILLRARCGVSNGTGILSLLPNGFVRIRLMGRYYPKVPADRRSGTDGPRLR